VDLSIRSTTLGQDDQSWLIQCDPSKNKGITLDKSLFTEATHFPDGYLKSGIVLGKVTSSGLYGPYNDSLSTGVEVAAGILYAAVPIRSTADVDPGGALMREGVVTEAKLSIANGATGRGYIDTAGKADLVDRIYFD
jgi:hypothetical protein